MAGNWHGKRPTRQEIGIAASWHGRKLAWQETDIECTGEDAYEII